MMALTIGRCTTSPPREASVEGLDDPHVGSPSRTLKTWQSSELQGLTDPHVEVEGLDDPHVEVEGLTGSSEDWNFLVGLGLS